MKTIFFVSFDDFVESENYGDKIKLMKNCVHNWILQICVLAVISVVQSIPVPENDGAEIIAIQEIKSDVNKQLVIKKILG